MKEEIRILGVDDAPFSFEDESVMIVGVVMRAGNYVEGVLRNDVAVDGTDSTEKLVEMISSSRFSSQLHAVLIDGASFGGFNVLDLEYIFSHTNLPIISITRDQPDFEKIKTALQSRFKDWLTRWEVLNKGSIWRMNTSHNPLYIRCVGISKTEAKEIIKLATIRGVLPEPVRMAHIIASGVVRGESYGKA